ncbi:MAG: hypothetical protein ACI4LE_06160, partial [Faecalibacterium sp.]
HHRSAKSRPERAHGVNARERFCSFFEKKEPKKLFNRKTHSRFAESFRVAGSWAKPACALPCAVAAPSKQKQFDSKR